jgi:hypothetical protein
MLRYIPVQEFVWFLLTVAGAIGGLAFSELGWHKPVIDYSRATATDFFELKFYDVGVYRSKMAEPVLTAYSTFRWLSFIACTIAGAIVGSLAGYLLIRFAFRYNPVYDPKENSNNKLKRPISQILFGTLGLSIILGAFLWGNHLLGFIYGVVYAVAALAPVGLLLRLLVWNEQPLVLPSIIVVAFAACLGYLYICPTAFSPDMQHYIDMQASDRAIRKELGTLFASDQAFSNLSASTSHLKAVCVTIYGSVPNRATLDRLRGRITNECKEIQLSSLNWDVTLQENGLHVTGRE